MCTLWDLELAKKFCNSINNSCTQNSRLYFFLWLWLDLIKRIGKKSPCWTFVVTMTFFRMSLRISSSIILCSSCDYLNNSFQDHWKVCIIHWLWIHYLRLFSILKNHKLNRIIDLYKALYKIPMTKYNTIKSNHVKSAMTGKKVWKTISFYKTQDLRETFSFN